MQNLLSTERVKELGNSRRHDSMKMVSEYRLGWNELQQRQEDGEAMSHMRPVDARTCADTLG